MAGRRLLLIVFLSALFGCNQAPPAPSTQPQANTSAADPLNGEYRDLMAMLKEHQLDPESNEMKVKDALEYVRDVTDGEIQVDLENLAEAGANLDGVLQVKKGMTLAELLDDAIRMISNDDLQVGYEIRATAHIGIRQELPNRPNRIPTTPFNDQQAKAEQVNRITATPDSKDPTKVYIPSDLDDCFVELKRMLHPTLVEKMKTHPEDDMSDYHFGLGMWLRNNWGLWSDGSRLGQYFEKMGIHHPDDMSGIILNSFHRHLNSRPLELDKQIAFYHAYWKKQREEQAKNANSDSPTATTQKSTSDGETKDDDGTGPEDDEDQENGKE